jgi:hypothetical protein
VAEELRRHRHPVALEGGALAEEALPMICMPICAMAPMPPPPLPMLFCPTSCRIACSTFPKPPANALPARPTPSVMPPSA